MTNDIFIFDLVQLVLNFNDINNVILLYLFWREYLVRKNYIILGLHNCKLLTIEKIYGLIDEEI